MAAAASTSKASRASSQHVASPHDQQTTAGAVALVAAAATPSKQPRSKQPRKKNPSGVAQPGERALIPRQDAGANPAVAANTPKKHPGGRPTRRTPSAREIVLKALKAGASYKLAASAANMGYSTLNDWMSKDADFALACRKAESDRALKALRKIEKAAEEGNWQAAAWYLERRHTEEYGRTIQQQVQSGEVTHTLRIVYVDDWRSKQPALDEPQNDNIIDAEKAS